MSTVTQPRPATPSRPTAPLPPTPELRPAGSGWALETAVGSLYLEGDEQALTRVGLPGWRPGPRAAIQAEPPTPVRAAAEQIQQYLAGERRAFALTLRTTGTEFQRAVWHALGEIPYGETVSYAELAEMVGRPGACRAVGQANGRNPIPLILPCHRVIAAGGGLGGFGGGLELKRALLDLEGAPM